MGYSERDIASTARNWRMQSERYQFTQPFKPNVEKRNIEKYDFKDNKVEKIGEKEEVEKATPSENGHNIIPLPPQKDRALASAGD